MTIRYDGICYYKVEIMDNLLRQLHLISDTPDYLKCLGLSVIREEKTVFPSRALLTLLNHNIPLISIYHVITLKISAEFFTTFFKWTVCVFCCQSTSLFEP